MTEARIKFLFRYLHARGVDPTDAHDIVQEVLLAVFEARQDFDAWGIDALAWLATVARRTATRHRVRARRRSELPTPDEDLMAVADEAPDPEEQTMLESRTRFLRGLLAALTEDQLRVMIAHDIKGMTFEQIAAELGMPLGTVFTHHRAGMAALRGARTRWQARQAWRRLPLIPAILAPFLGVRRAWAAGSRAVHRRLGVKALAAAAAASLVLWSAAGHGDGEEAATTARALPSIAPPALIPPEAAPHEAQASTAPPASEPAASEPERTPPPPLARAEELLMLQARAAMEARSYAAAREALELHARRYPRGRYAGERRDLLARLRAPAASAPARGRAGHQ